MSYAKSNLLIPPLPEQKAIAHILGTLDDKIELNQQMNRTLEATAREIFKSWFVDFDPVRAKMDGRQPEGMDVQTAALFPDTFEDSELGMIPQEWKVIQLGQEIQLTKGRSYIALRIKLRTNKFAETLLQLASASCPGAFCLARSAIKAANLHLQQLRL